MAGDWIKMRVDLQTHPKVVRILSETDSDKFRVIGGLHAVWAVFDAHCTDGTLVGYSFKTMDHIVGWAGFSSAMSSVGWLEESAQGLVMPGFQEHNGQSAKRRGEDTRRKREQRNSKNSPQPVRKMSQEMSGENGTREEKRREEVVNNPLCASDDAPPKESPPKPAPEPKGPTPAEVDAAFEIFWTAGMRKVDKKKARSAFASRLKHLDADPHAFAQQLYDDVTARCTAKQMGFDMMHPTTYLNGERWNDEICAGTDDRGGNRLSPLEEFERDIRARDERAARDAPSGLDVAQADRNVRGQVGAGPRHHPFIDLDSSHWQAKS